MNFTSENIQGIILMITSILVLLTTYYGSILEKPTKFIKGIDIFSKFSVIFIAFGIFITYMYYRQNLLEIRRNNTLRMQENGFINTTKTIHSLYEKCPKFCNSLFYSWQQYDINKYKNVEEDWMSKYTISIIIFQTIENVIDAQDVDNSSFNEWCALFMQWLQSSYIQKIWKTSYHNQNELTTVPFVSMLIDFINKNKQPNNSKELHVMATEISNHPEIQRIIHTK
jgi:hypothetical protein